MGRKFCALALVGEVMTRKKKRVVTARRQFLRAQHIVNLLNKQ